MEAIIEFIKILVPASVVLFGAFWIVKMFIAKEIELKRLDVRADFGKEVLPTRLTAYERMSIFLERMSPQSLLMRVSQEIVLPQGVTMPASVFQARLLDEVRREFDHNVAQQIYISETVWTLIRNAKEDLILTINDAAGNLHPDAIALDLSKAVFEKAINKHVDPLAHALSELKKEIQVIF